MPADRANALENAPLNDLYALLLKQFRRLLAQHDITLTDAELNAIAGAAANRETPDERVQAIRAALIRIVAESEAVLARWSLGFAESLGTSMDDLGGWETTAEFLDIANEKSNAELRIAAASALVAALGDMRYGDYLLYLAQHPEYDDVNAVIARRTLSARSGIDQSADDWIVRVQRWLAQQKDDS